MSRTCLYCRYRRQLDNDAICIRHAPRPELDPKAPTDPGARATKQDGYYSVRALCWPIVRDDDGCGDWEPCVGPIAQDDAGVRWQRALAHAFEEEGELRIQRDRQVGMIERRDAKIKALRKRVRALEKQLAKGGG